jgi:hypothetical protein
LSVPGLALPFESVHALSPGPPDPSVQEKLVATDWLRLYVCPSVGELIGANGGAAVENTDTLLLPRFAVASSPEVNATAYGPVPVVNGKPDIAVSAPVVWSTANTDTVLPPWFATASSPPPGLNATESGNDPDPVANGEPDSAVSAPVVWLAANTTTARAVSATASSPPPGLNATEYGVDPVANGDPETAVPPPAALS